MGSNFQDFKRQEERGGNDLEIIIINHNLQAYLRDIVVFPKHHYKVSHFLLVEDLAFNLKNTH